MITFHHNDADGRASAAIAKRWFYENSQERRIFVEMDYSKPFSDNIVENIQKTDTVVIVDFSFPLNAMKEIEAATDRRIIWCDHHQTAKDYNYDYDGYRDFNDKSQAGCECTWKYFYPNAPVPTWIRILGDYDCWRMKEPEACRPFYEGLKLENQSIEGFNTIWDQLLDDATGKIFNQIVSNGIAAIKYRDNYCSAICKDFGYETEIDGVKAYALNIQRFGSLGFGELFDNYPICLAYIHNGDDYYVSLYSQTVNVADIAKKYGGGGHKGAAGFRTKVLPFGKKK